MDETQIELQEDWTIGLDVTSIMVLTHLDLLETALDAVHHTKLAPDVMEFLFREKVEVRFHQPSRIRAAKQVRELQIRGQLRTTDNVVVPPKGHHRRSRTRTSHDLANGKT